MFIEYCNSVYDEQISDWDKNCFRSPRQTIEADHLNYFPEWKIIVKDLSKLYGNIDTYYLSLMQTGEKSINTIHAGLHNDSADVVHINCFGQVEWTLVDPNDVDQKENKVVLEPGDMLYMRGMTLHQTIPLTKRGSLIFMTLPLNTDYNFSTDNQKEMLLEGIKSDLSNKRYI